MTINQLKYEIDCVDDFYNSLIKEGLIESCKKENHLPNCWPNAELEIHNKLLELKSLKEKESISKNFEFNFNTRDVEGNSFQPFYNNDDGKFMYGFTEYNGKAYGSIKMPMPNWAELGKTYVIKIREK